MTAPTITYQHGWLHDGDATTNWYHEDGAPDLTSGAIAISNGDYLDISCTNVDHDGDFCYWTYLDETPAPDIGISTTTYPKLLIRYKTDVASAGLGLAVKAVYHDGPDTAEWVLGTDTAPVYSTLWKVETATLATDHGALDHIRLYGALKGGTAAGHIYVDFILVCQGIWPFPYVSGGVELEGANVYVDTPIPGKVGLDTQYIGGDVSPIHIYGDIDVATGWHISPNTIDLDILYRILHYSFQEPWQWFTSNVGNLKVVVDRININQVSSNEAILGYHLLMHEYRLGSASAEQSYERFGLI